MRFQDDSSCLQLIIYPVNMQQKHTTAIAVMHQLVTTEGHAKQEPMAQRMCMIIDVAQGSTINIVLYDSRIIPANQTSVHVVYSYQLPLEREQTEPCLSSYLLAGVLLPEYKAV
jgi:hypothetical protein